MTISFVALSPSAGVYTVARPPVNFTLSTDATETSITLTYWMSKLPTPKTDPSAYTNATSLIPPYTGFTSNSTINVDLPVGANLTPGTWYITGEVRYANNTLIGTITNTFTVTFTPAATQVTPGPGEARPFVNTTSNLLLSWAFSGNVENNDAQTAYQVIVSRVSDNLTVVDTGKVVSPVGQAIVTVAQTYADIQLSWKVRVWNKWDTPSAYTSGRIFTLVLTFTLNITSPTNNQVMTAGNPNLTVGITVSAGRTVKKINASAWQAEVKVWDKTVYGNWATGASVNITDSTSVFAIGAYTYRVVAQDNLDSYSAEFTRNFSVSYTAPVVPSATPTQSITNYDTLGYIAVAWNDSTRDSEFLCWAIERRDDPINTTTQAVISTGTWTEIGRVYTTGASYTFNDYLAPSNHRVSYRIVQVALKWGTEVRSTPSAVTSFTFPVTESYWLYAGINGDPLSVVTKLYNVVSDSYTDEQESAVFNLMGRGRYSERGSRLGVMGQLAIHLRDNADGTARTKRLALQSFKNTYGTAKLRNPFGSIFNVTLGDLQIELLPGTGKSEFSDVNIPYIEVVS